MKHRFDSLDGLRAIACLLVIWQHVSEILVSQASSGLWATELAAFFDFGRIGVVAFFCISGFVIPNSLRGGRIAGVKNFLINRFFRLYPIYWLSIPLGILCVWTIWGHEPSAAIVWGNLTMAMTYIGAQPLMGLYWTLEIELAFYLLCAALYLGFGNLRFPILAAAFLVCNWVYRNDFMSRTPENLPLLFYFLSIMLASSCARCAYDLGPKSEKWIRVAHWLAVALMFKIVLGPPWKAAVKSFSLEDPVWNKFGFGHGLGVVLFLLILLLPRLSSKFAPIGRATYSAYLLHAIVFNLLLKAWSVYGLPNTRMELFIAIASVATFGIALASYRYIELPCIGFAKRLTGQKLDTIPELAPKGSAASR